LDGTYTVVILKVFLRYKTVNPTHCYFLDLVVFFLGFLEIDSELTFDNKSTLSDGMITVNSSLDLSASKRLDRSHSLFSGACDGVMLGVTM